MSDSLRLGVKDFMIKPALKDKLESTIEKVLLEKKIEKCTDKIYKGFFKMFTVEEISVMIMNGIKQ